jgi:hypothetical protein
MATTPAFEVSLKAREIYKIIMDRLEQGRFFLLKEYGLSEFKKTLEIIKDGHNSFKLNVSLTVAISNKDLFDSETTLNLNTSYSKDTLLLLIVEEAAKDLIKKQVVDTLNYSIENLRFQESNLVEKDEDEVLGFRFTLTEDWHGMDR